jgi:hypothetical protein
LVGVIKKFDLSPKEKEVLGKDHMFSLIHIELDHDLVYDDGVDEDFHNLRGKRYPLEGDIVDICTDTSTSSVHMILERISKGFIVEFKVHAIRTVRGEQ